MVFERISRHMIDRGILPEPNARYLEEHVFGNVVGQTALHAINGLDDDLQATAMILFQAWASRLTGDTSNLDQSSVFVRIDWMLQQKGIPLNINGADREAQRAEEVNRIKKLKGQWITVKAVDRYPNDKSREETWVSFALMNPLGYRPVQCLSPDQHEKCFDGVLFRPDSWIPLALVITSPQATPVIPLPILDGVVEKEWSAYRFLD